MSEPTVAQVKMWLEHALEPPKRVPPEVQAKFPRQGWTSPGRSNYIQLMEAYIRLKTEDEKKSRCPECGQVLTKGDRDAAGICGSCYWRLHDADEA